jgi:PTS system nitrogen regulatory IIA component
MNPLEPLLRDDQIVLDADLQDGDALLRMGADLLASHAGLRGQEMYQALLAREKLGSTALGHGIAIPHARIAGMRNPACAYVRTLRPIAFGARDGKPVSQFLFLLVPAEANEKHLQLMAAAAGLLSDSTVRRELGSCSRCADVRELVAAWDEAEARSRAS